MPRRMLSSSQKVIPRNPCTVLFREKKKKKKRDTRYVTYLTMLSVKVKLSALRSNASICCSTVKRSVL